MEIVPTKKTDLYPAYYKDNFENAVKQIEEEQGKPGPSKRKKIKFDSDVSM